MKTIEKMLFRLQRCAILQTKINPQTNSFISDDYAYAWYSSVYPLFDENELTKLYKDVFEVKKEIVEEVLKYLDSELLNEKCHTFYEIEGSFKKSEINRYQLIPILRYVYLSDVKIDQKFWDVLLTSGECPREAKGIISEFDILDTIKVNLL